MPKKHSPQKENILQQNNKKTNQKYDRSLASVFANPMVGWPSNTAKISPKTPYNTEKTE